MTAATICLLLAGATSQPDTGAAILARARRALGGPKLAALTSLAVKAHRRSADPGNPRGELELVFAGSDRFARTEVLPVGDASVKKSLILNGVEASMRVQGSGDVSIRRASETPEGRLALTALRRREQARLLAAFQLRSDGLAVTHVGSAEAPGGRAEVLELCVVRDDCFRLFVDQRSHLPLMLSYRDTPRSVGKPVPLRETTTGSVVSVESTAEWPVEVTMHFAAHRQVKGILFPHEISFSVDGETTQEWQQLQFEPNVAVTPDQFRVGGRSGATH
jgi:hypothetical protein